MRKRKIIAYYSEYQRMYLFKDAFLIPLYLAKRNGLELHCYYNYNIGIGSDPTINEYRGAKFHNNSRKAQGENLSQLLEILWIVISNLYTLDILFTCHISPSIKIVTLIYKWLRPDGNVVVMADLEELSAQRLAACDFVDNEGRFAWAKRWLTTQFFKKAIVTVENEPALQALTSMYNRHGWKGLAHVHPCIDDEMFRSLGLQLRPFEKKERAFLFVGRIGNEQKNTDMILSALEKVDLKDWKFYMVGPFSKNFDLRGDHSDEERAVEDFFRRKPEHRGKVIFTGAIFDQDEVFRYYLRSRVFVLASRHEGFCNALSEAAALGCYIVSTDVGGAKIVSNNWQFGTALEQENAEGLAQVLQAIVDGAHPISVGRGKTFSQLSWSNMISERVIPLLKGRKNNV